MGATDDTAAEGMLPILRRYGGPDPERHDEALGPDGKLRPHWRGFFEWLNTTGRDGMSAAAAELDRLRAESGVAFAARADRTGGGAAALPILIDHTDWRELEAGVLQRARLAEAALADLYSPAPKMIAEGWVPPALVYAQPEFAAHCAAWETQPDRYLYVYEADVARDAAGNWILLGDRLDAPLGDGWLLANRIAVSQALAEPFVDLGVRRLASHYTDFQAMLDQLTGWEGRLALLTGGDKDPRFFSHAYFARYLNATLIEAADITVREGAAFVKTLDGLKKLDFLLRGVPDMTLDALHRPLHATTGAPALSLAVRSGRLQMANAIGASVMGGRALAPYAHRLAEGLLGEEQLLPDAPCLWLGDPAAVRRVLDEPALWRVEPICGGTPDGDMPPHDPEHVDAMRAFLRLHGARHAAVATPPLATTPVWRGASPLRAEWMMRVFACRTQEGWSLAPGGVGAVVEPGTPPPALDFGKDVWVIAPEGERSSVPSLIAGRMQGAHLRRTGRDLLSRVADELFWLGRNAERAESTLRILNVCLRRYLSGNRVDADPKVLCQIAEIHAVPARGEIGMERFRDAVRRLTGVDGEPWGLQTTLPALRSGAIRARASVSEETWRYIDRLCSDPRWRERLDLRKASELLRLIEDSLRVLAAVAGSAQENLTRNYAWRFLEMGRRIERGYEAARTAERLAGRAQENEETYLRAWLTLSDSAVAYRSRYLMTPQAAAVLDLLVLDESNPRALAFQLRELEHVLAQLPSDVPYRRPDHRRALALLTRLRLSDADALAEVDERGGRARLTNLCTTCKDGLAEVSDLIAQAFFAHADIPEVLVSRARLGAARDAEEDAQ